jgi:hypothetical protein
MSSIFSCLWFDLSWKANGKLEIRDEASRAVDEFSRMDLTGRWDAKYCW